MGDAATPHLPIVLDLILKPHAPLEIDDRPQASAKARLKANLARQRHNEAAAAANDADDDDARVAVDVLAHCGVHAMAVVPALATACEGSEAAVREKARMALTSLAPMICGQDADILRTLLPNLASSAMHDDDESARNAAVYALGAALGARATPRPPPARRRSRCAPNSSPPSERARGGRGRVGAQRRQGRARGPRVVKRRALYMVILPESASVEPKIPAPTRRRLVLRRTLAC